MRVIYELSVICAAQEDYLADDDIRISLDGHEIARFKMDDGSVGDTGVRILHGGDKWPVHAGSRIVVEEVDLLDPNDILLDHTFTADDLLSSIFDLTGTGGGDYRFVFTLENQGDTTLAEHMKEDTEKWKRGEF